MKIELSPSEEKLLLVLLRIDGGALGLSAAQQRAASTIHQKLKAAKQ